MDIIEYIEEFNECSQLDLTDEELDRLLLTLVLVANQYDYEIELDYEFTFDSVSL